MENLWSTWKAKIPRRFLLVIAPIWVVCLVVGSLLPGRTKAVIGTSRLAEQHQYRRAILVGDWKHRSFHVLGFGATSLLLLALARNRSQEVAYTIGVMALGLGIETAQVFVYHNGLELEDVRDDCYGALVGLAVVVVASLLPSARHTSPTSTR